MSYGFASNLRDALPNASFIGDNETFGFHYSVAPAGARRCARFHFHSSTAQNRHGAM